MTVVDAPLPLPDGQFLVPGNRWDLLDRVTPIHPPTVSVIVPYYDGQGQLDRLLGALGAQTHASDHLQIIVADDGSPTPPIVRAPAGLQVEVVTQERRGFRAAAARNLGAARADGDILCFLDQDTWPEPGYVHAMTRLPALLPDALVTGRRRHADLDGYDVQQVTQWIGGRSPDDGAVLAEPSWLLDQHEASGDLLQIGPESNRYVISAVMACSRRLFHEIGGFDEDFVRYGGEDWEFAHRALCAGAVLAHVPDAVAWHDGPSWADRGDPEARRQQRNEETAFVVARIPAALRPRRRVDGSAERRGRDRHRRRRRRRGHSRGPLRAGRGRRPRGLAERPVGPIHRRRTIRVRSAGQRRSARRRQPWPAPVSTRTARDHCGSHRTPGQP